MPIFGKFLCRWKLCKRTRLGNKSNFSGIERLFVADGFTSWRKISMGTLKYTNLGYWSKGTCRSLVLIWMRYFRCCSNEPYWYSISSGSCTWLEAWIVRGQTTFFLLCTTIDEQIYMTQLEGFIEENKEILVCHQIATWLEKTSKCWHKWFDSFILSYGYRRCEANHSDYFHVMVIISLLSYICNMIVGGTMIALECWKLVSLENMRIVNRYLDASVCTDRKNMRVWITYKGYIERVLCHFNMQNVKQVSTPFSICCKLSSIWNEIEKADMSQVLYGSAAWNLMFGGMCSTQDIAQAEVEVSNTWQIRKEIRRVVVKWILCCLDGTSHF